MTYEEAYIKVCEGYKNGKPIENLIKKYLYTLNPQEDYPSLNFDMWLRWACSESCDDESNPILILCMAEYLKQQLRWIEGSNNFMEYEPLNESTRSALTVIDTINWFSLDDNNPPTNIITYAVRYLFNKEDINAIISKASGPIDKSMISKLPECRVEYYSRHELTEFFTNEERNRLEQCGINPECPF